MAQTSEAYLALHQPIQPQAVVPAIGHLNRLETEGIQRIVLLIQTIGGRIDAGVALYERLRALKCHLVTHAFGEVASMGVPIYLAGDERLVGPHCSFLLHRPTVTLAEDTRLDIPVLEAHIAELEVVEQRTGSIYLDRTPITADELHALRANETTLRAEEAVRHGIAHSIEPFTLPHGQRLIGIGRPGQVLEATTQSVEG